MKNQMKDITPQVYEPSEHEIRMKARQAEQERITQEQREARAKAREEAKKCLWTMEEFLEVFGGFPVGDTLFVPPKNSDE